MGKSTRRPNARASDASKQQRLLARAEAVGRRLAGELRAMLAAAGYPPCSIRALARTLGVDANICQRAASASRAADEPLQALRHTPGLEGLERLRLACANAGVELALTEALRAATFELEQLLSEHGGSLIRLRAWLDRATTNGARGEPMNHVRHRRQAVHGLRACLGSRLDTHAVAVFMSTATKRASGKGAGQASSGFPLLEGFMLNVYTGWRSRPDGMPLVLGSLGRSAIERERAAADGGDLLAQGGFLLEKYCSQKRSFVTERVDSAGNSLQVLASASAHSEDGPPFTAAIVNPFRSVESPFAGTPPMHTSFVRARYPTDELLLDVFMHRDLAATCVPTGSVSWTGTWLYQGDEMPWYDRVPERVPVSILPGSSIGNPCKHCPWYADAVGLAASRVGFDIDEFVCHRLYMPFPIWGAAHIICFHFGGVADRPARKPG